MPPVPQMPFLTPTVEQFKFFESLVGKAFTISNNSDVQVLRGREVYVTKYLGGFLFEVNSEYGHFQVQNVDLVIPENDKLFEMSNGKVYRATKLVEVETHLVKINDTVFEIENVELAESGSVINAFTGSIKSIIEVGDDDNFIKIMKDNKREFPW